MPHCSMNIVKFNCSTSPFCNLAGKNVGEGMLVPPEIRVVQHCWYKRTSVSLPSEKEAAAISKELFEEKWGLMN